MGGVQGYNADLHVVIEILPANRSPGFDVDQKRDKAKAGEISEWKLESDGGVIITHQ